MISRIAILALGLGIAQGAAAQSVTLTVKDGRALVVGGEALLGADLAATDLDAAAIVAEFGRLCLDPATVGDRVTASPFGLSEADAVFPAEGKQGEARVKQWRGSAALVSAWTGDDANLKNRAIAMPSRGAVTRGPYGPFRAFGTQCNLVFGVRDFSSVGPLIEALRATYGEPGKLVVKNSFADGFWAVSAGGASARVNLNTPTTRNGPQPVHLSMQMAGPTAK
jgi:hypothetical protein